MATYIQLFVLALMTVSVRGQDELNCCASYLMDSDSRVVLERGTQLVPSTGSVFNVVKVKFCIREPINIQLWRPSTEQTDEVFIPVGDEPPVTYQLIWQIRYEPTSSTPMGEWIEIPLGAAVPIEPEYRLGLHSYESYKFAISYDFNAGYSPLYMSFSRGNMGQAHALYTTLVFDTLPWPWSYYYHIRFCYQDPEGLIEEFCINGESPPIVVLVGPPGPPGEQGAQGEQGVPGIPGLPGEPCFASDIPLMCQADDTLLDRIQLLEDATNTLINQIDGVSGIVNDNLLTGGCPDDFVSGTYGLGYCYYFGNVAPAPLQFGAYAFWCWDEHKALPVFIESEIEESFLVSNILDRMTETETTVTYGTSGMYRDEDALWVWFSETTDMRAPFVYTNWAEDEPQYFGQLQACMGLTVNSDKTHNWYSRDCREQVYFICKKPKNCY